MHCKLTVVTVYTEVDFFVYVTPSRDVLFLYKRMEKPKLSYFHAAGLSRSFLEWIAAPLFYKLDTPFVH